VVLVVGATNRPQELDEAARRRFVKRLYIPLPEAEARRSLLTLLLRKNSNSLTGEEIEQVVTRTEGFSGADVRALCTEAAMGPIRDMGTDIQSVRVAEVPPIRFQHFLDALASTRPSVSDKDLGTLQQWNQDFGTFPRAHINEPTPSS
jgi:fidgetin-like protein 1